MNTDFKDFHTSALGFTRSPLGIIALFIVLIYGFATLSVTFGDNLKEYIALLVYFLILFPVFVFIGFLWLVSKHHDKIYGPSDFKNEDNFIKMKMSSAASLAVATVSQSKEIQKEKDIQEQIDSIIEMVSKTTFNNKESYSTYEWKKRILWVDDRPENNIYERHAFESQGLSFSLALSTKEALEILKNNKYAAIISDMERKEGDQEGYVLLDKIRKMKNQTPFFIYASSNLPAHKRLAQEKGVQGSTNSAQELFEMVMNVVNKL